MKNEDENWKKVITEIKKVKKNKKLTDQQIGDKIGMKQQNVNKALSLNSNPRIGTIVSIMKALEIDVHLIY